MANGVELQSLVDDVFRRWTDALADEHSRRVVDRLLQKARDRTFADEFVTVVDDDERDDEAENEENEEDDEREVRELEEIQEGFEYSSESDEEF